MNIIWWLLQNWLPVLYLGAIGAGYIIGGWRLALGVATLGAGVLLYRQGQKDAERTHEERADRLDKEREDAYREIDNRGTTGDDVVERLRRNDY